MDEQKPQKQRANRVVWLNAALAVLNERGVDGIKIVPLAKRLSLTSGSFYWHFKNVQDLLDSVLDHWENHLTDHIVRDAQNFVGPPEKRILNLMLQVIRENAAVPDHAISVWAKSDAKVQLSYQRTIAKRFEFAQWMFEQAGFSSPEAAVRGRLMVVTLMGEASNNLIAIAQWEDTIRAQWQFLVAR